MFIRASRETHSGELVLIVRPNGNQNLHSYVKTLPQSYTLLSPHTLSTII